MLIPYETMFHSDQILNRSRANLIYIQAPVTGVLKEIRLMCIGGVVGAGTWTLNVKVNGSPIFFGEDKPKFVGTGTQNVLKTGLNLPVTVGQSISVDIETAGSGRLTSPISFIAVIDDGKAGSTFSVDLTTGSLANLAKEIGTITFGEAFTLEQVVRDYNCRVQLYQTSAARTADASREIGTDPDNAGGSGIIADLNLESGDPLRWQLAPPAKGFNGDVPEGTVIYYSVQNRSGSTRAINLTFIGTVDRKK